MDKYEEFAIGQYLSDWPENASFEEIMDIMNLNDCALVNEIMPWEPMEHTPMPEIARLIMVTLNSLKERFK